MDYFLSWDFGLNMMDTGKHISLQYFDTKDAPKY